MLLLIDKPSGLTSFDVIRQLRRKLGIRKIGHAGTLDPLATGLLVLATDKDTKKLTEFLKLDKEYEVEMEFGKVSDTYDIDGRIMIVNENPDVSRVAFEKALMGFLGEIEQMPPAFSAIKIKGKHAYEYARNGEKVALPSRKIKIHHLDLIEFSPPTARLLVQCGSGTYIRSLVHDLGQEIGCGAVVKNLRRIKIGSYHIREASCIDSIT